MNIAFVEIQNFRKLKSCRIDISGKTTVFVGANNSGKTSAMIALKKFVKTKHITLEDFTISNWSKINKIGEKYVLLEDETPISIDEWENILPSLDVWINVASDEVRYVSNMIPTLDWNGGKIGIRLLFEPKDITKLFSNYKEAYLKARSKSEKIQVWPINLIDFLSKKLSSCFQLNAYILDEIKLKDPDTDNIAKPQETPYSTAPLEGNLFDTIVQVDIISAQRGFEDIESEISDTSSVNGSLLSAQLRDYYDKQLNPEQMPTDADLAALEKIQGAKQVFNKEISKKFKSAMNELAKFGYPGKSNPKIIIETHAKTSEMLNHNTIVKYPLYKDGEIPYTLPEQYNGLGYQNLISMSFKLMNFRDTWINGNKNREEDDDVINPIKPLHLVLIEEPEAHLHAQVQQVFIKNAYKILCNKVKKQYSTQMIVTTHSSYIALETNFAELRYFKRIKENTGLPVSVVVNLCNVFGNNSETSKFVSRYLKTTHCDLFFADAVIIVEGAGERILLPHFIKYNFPNLDQAYVSILEISGRHAHRLKNLIEHLGIFCLIITDLDTVDQMTKKSVTPKKGQSQITTNTTLNDWVPKETSVDILANIKFEDKVTDNGGDASSVIRVAYQFPVKVAFSDKTTHELFPTTFEDALAYSNFETFKKLTGNGLIKKFKKSFKKENAEQIIKDSYEALQSRGVKKAEFALDLLYAKDPKQIIPPQYINEALKWLQEQLVSKDNADFLEKEG